jgi:hypothetical protein
MLNFWKRISLVVFFSFGGSGASLPARLATLITRQKVYI